MSVTRAHLIHPEFSRPEQSFCNETSKLRKEYPKNVEIVFARLAPNVLRLRGQIVNLVVKPTLKNWKTITSH